MKLADEVEDSFVKQFAQDNRRKAMKYLKPTQRKESHAVTFLIGVILYFLLLIFVIKTEKKMMINRLGKLIGH